MVPPAAHCAFCSQPSWGPCPALSTSPSHTLPALSPGRGGPLRDGTILAPGLSQLDQGWTLDPGQANQAWIQPERPWPVSVEGERAPWLEPQVTLWTAEGEDGAGMREERGPGASFPTAQLPLPWGLCPLPVPTRPCTELLVHHLSQRALIQLPSPSPRGQVSGFPPTAPQSLSGLCDFFVPSQGPDSWCLLKE